MAAIELNNLVKRYGVGARAVQVLHGVSAEIHDGEFVVIVGPSGCGKSTLCAWWQVLRTLLKAPFESATK